MKRLIDTFELDPIELPEGEPLRFRIEVFVDQNDGRFSSRILRWESMRFQPSFASHDGSEALPGADYSILVEDDSIDVSEIAAATSSEVLQEVMAQIDRVVAI